MSNIIQFYHFDTAQRDNLMDDPFQCQLTLSNPLRNVKKIYLKSCEIPVGYFNIRTPQYFEFTSAIDDFAYGSFDIDSVSLFTYRPNWSNSYNTPATDSSGNYTRKYAIAGAGTNGQLTIPQEEIFKISIGIVPGNYTIDSLIKYINDAIARLITIYYDDFTYNGSTPSAVLSIVRVVDTGLFPVGYLKFTRNIDDYSIILPTEFSYKYLGFTSYKNNQQIGQTGTSDDKFTIKSLRLWNMYPDLSIYMYLENIPHTNTHFKNNLASYKIPITSGYQSIEYNADNQNFAQYIENTNVNFILDKLKLKVYDRYNNLLTNNGFDWTFTLGIEYFV